ncbi:MAG: PepSY domain-containing protein [Rhodospirillales bacterium]|jgi:uncharacterized membrane protein YkoI|nr:PepSY domain-containing protein [Rhodospirillales bacterium]
MPRLNRRDLLRIGLCAAATLTIPVAFSGEDGEHDNARGAVERGEALPLAEILARVGGDLGGEITRMSFEREHGAWVYEFKVVEPSGRLVEVYVDAANGRILERETD